MKTTMTRVAAFGALLSLGACGSLDFFGESETPLSGTRIPVRSVEASGAIRIDAPDAAIVLPAPVANADWPQINGNASRSLGHVAAPASLRQVWSADSGAGSGSSARIVSPAVVAGGKVFALDAGATVSAFDAGSGARIWARDLTPEGENTIDGFGGGLAVDGGQVIVVNGFGEMHALSAGTGEVVWTASIGAPSRAAPAVVAGRAFAVTRDNRIVAVDTESGRVIWAEQGLEQPAGILGGAAPAAIAEVVVAPFSSGELNAYAADSGNIGWIEDLTGSRGSSGLAALNDVSGDPVIADGVVYAATQSGTFVAIDLRTGERQWTKDIGSLQPPLVAGNAVFIVSVNGTLVAALRESGAVVWTSELGAFEDPEDREDPITWAGPVAAGGRLLLTSDTGRLISVDPANGSILGELALPDGASTAPVVAGNTVYVLTDGATLAAYR